MSKGAKSQDFPPVVDMVRHLDAARPNVRWMADIAQRAAAFVELDPERPAAPYLRLATLYAHDAAKAVEQGDAAAACLLGAAAMAAAHQSELVEALPRWFLAKVAPKFEVGEKFTDGRKPGAAGAVRRAVRKALKARPNATAKEVWTVLADKPPPGMAFCDNRLGQYIESKGAKNTSYRRFCNIVSEEKNPR